MCTRNQAFEILKIVYHACDPILGHSIHDAILYGSYARGDFTAESDIDILLTADLIDKLSGEFPLGQPIIGEQKQKDFIKLYGNILRLKNILSAFDQFAGNEILPERDFQDYQSVYLDLYQAYRPKTDGDKENINDNITFEIELIRQVEINIDYILMLVMKYHESNCKEKSILGTINRAIDSSIQRLAQFFEKYFGI